ncbi:MAG: ribosome maturation factor RimM [Oscillospiraceae bacterium]|jgi:16S rRNA processing protein RimM|nr:ribosome maturation factor RimM [Oscillospiraceae bacterium]
MILDFLEIGQIVGTHGVQGELRVNPWCDSPQFFKNFKTLYYDAKGQVSIEVLSARVHGNIVLLKLEGVDTVQKASALRERILFIKKSDAKLAPDDFFIQELIGCAVIDADSKKEYGELCYVSYTGANDVWHIKKDDREYLIPAIADVVIKTDVEAGVIEIRPLRGIFDDEY